MTAHKFPAHLAVAGSLCAVLALAACGGDDNSSAASDAGTKPAAAATETAAAPASGGDLGCPAAKGATVGYSEPLPDPNFKAIEKVISGALEPYGARLKPVNANLDPGKQVSDIGTLIDQGVKVLIANPIDPNATQPAFNRARTAKIPIIAQETTKGGPFATNVTADVEAAAREGAQILEQSVGDGAVGAVNGPALAEVIVRENKTFAQTAKSLGLTVGDTQVNQQIRPEVAKSIADAWKQKFGKRMKGVWTFNDTSAVGVASSVGGDFTPAIVSINGQPDAIPLVKSGRILATFDLQQDKLGQALAYAALGALCDRSLPKEIVVPVKKIDKSNVAQWRPLTERAKDAFHVTLQERDGRTYIGD